MLVWRNLFDVLSKQSHSAKMHDLCNVYLQTRTATDFFRTTSYQFFLGRILVVNYRSVQSNQHPQNFLVVYRQANSADVVFYPHNRSLQYPSNYRQIPPCVVTCKQTHVLIFSIPLIFQRRRISTLWVRSRNGSNQVLKFNYMSLNKYRYWHIKIVSSF